LQNIVNRQSRWLFPGFLEESFLEDPGRLVDMSFSGARVFRSGKS